jgi:uncharacterized membrane protein
LRTAQFERLGALDATRGIALVLVCIAHFIDVYYGTAPKDNWLLNDLSIVSKTATPSFVLVSGILLGYLSNPSHLNFPNLRVHILDRAIFMITAGHLLMAASYATREDPWIALSRGYVTDTLGCCILAGLLVVRYAKAPWTQLVLGLMIYVIGWEGWNEWHPDNSVFLTLRGIGLGPDQSNLPIFWFPLLPWFGVYLVGTAIGGWLSTFEKCQVSQAGKRLVWRSSLVLGAVLLAKAIVLMLHVSHSTYLPLISYSKSPPGPFYILTFGSAALVILGTLLWATKTLQTNTASRIAERMGRNALSLFITQSFFYYTAVYLFFSQTHMSNILGGLLLLIGSLLSVMWVSGVYERFHLNRFWTVGLTGRYTGRPV